MHGLNRTLSYDYDLAGRVTRQTLPDGRAIELGYDANGNLTSLIPPGQPAHLFDYTVLDQESEYTPPAVDTFDPATRYTYNRDQQPELITPPRWPGVGFHLRQRRTAANPHRPARRHRLCL